MIYCRERSSLSGQTISTERLTLKPLAAADAHGVWQMISDPAVLTYIPLEVETDETSFTRKFHAEIAAGVRYKFFYGIHIDGEPDIIGWVLLRPLEDGSAMEVGYWLRKAFWHHGIAAEAGRAMIKAQKHHVPFELGDIMAHVMQGNTGSKRVLEKIGLEKTGDGMLDGMPVWGFRWKQP